jgi:hypothetical protein
VIVWGGFPVLIFLISIILTTLTVRKSKEDKFDYIASSLMGILVNCGVTAFINVMLMSRFDKLTASEDVAIQDFAVIAFIPAFYGPIVVRLLWIQRLRKPNNRVSPSQENENR